MAAGAVSNESRIGQNSGVLGHINIQFYLSGVFLDLRDGNGVKHLF